MITKTNKWSQLILQRWGNAFRACVYVSIHGALHMANTEVTVELPGFIETYRNADY